MAKRKLKPPTRYFTVTLDFSTGGDVEHLMVEWPEKKKGGTFRDNIDRSLNWSQLQRWLGQAVKRGMGEK